MFDRFSQFGEVVICPRCNGYGYLDVENFYGKYLIPCEYCDAEGRIIKQTNIVKLKRNTMNTNFEEIPIGIKVQVKIIINAHNNEVWAIGYKSNEGTIIVEGFLSEKYKLVGWRAF